MKVHILNANVEVCFNKISTGVHMYIIGTYSLSGYQQSHMCLSLNTKKRYLLTFKIKWWIRRNNRGELDDISMVK